MNSESKRGFWDGLSHELFSAGYDYGEPQLSPNGKYVAYTMSNESGKNLYLYEIETTHHFQLTSENSLSTGTAYGGKTFSWGKDSFYLYYTSKGQFYKVSIQGGISTKLHNQGKQFSPSTNEKYLMFSVEHEDHMSLGLLQLNDDIEKSWSTRIPITENFLYDASFHPMNGSILVHTWSYPNMSWNGSKIELLIPTNKNYEQITRKVVAGSESIATSQPKFSPDGRKMTFFSEQTGWLNLWIANSDGSDPQPLVDEKCEHAYSTWVTGGSSYNLTSYLFIILISWD
ncbi:MAG: Protein TolB [Candidatus Heimdallarchaeota archaeon LC_2]|nr:MAG: Protein TolB [Candidatus Heimdallarchaeota archaeon LC_2]